MEIYHKGERLTTHNRFPDYMKNTYSIHPEDMPPAFRNIVQWDNERIRNWASAIGKSASQVIDRISESVSIKNRAIIPVLPFSTSAGRIQMPVWKLPVRLPSEEELRCPVITTFKQSCLQIKTFLTGNNRKPVLHLRTLLWDISVGATITGKGDAPNVKRRDQEKTSAYEYRRIHRYHRGTATGSTEPSLFPLKNASKN